MNTPQLLEYAASTIERTNTLGESYIARLSELAKQRSWPALTKVCRQLQDKEAVPSAYTTWMKQQAQQEAQRV